MSPHATRVLVPYISTYFGGVRRILGTGLPLLAREPGLELTYAELCRNDDDMDELERSGVAVERALGVPGPAALGAGAGLLRLVAIANQLPRLARMAARLADHLRAFDVCYVHGHRELLLAAAARLAMRSRPGPAIVWHWHGPPLTLAPGPRGTWLARQFVRVVSPACARVVAISRFCAAQAIGMGVDPGRVLTVENAAAIEDRRASAAASLPPRARGEVALLLPCASIRKHKGVHVAIEALAHLPPEHVLWVTGDTGDVHAAAYVGELRRLAERLGVAGRVRFVGARKDVHRVMSAADVVVVPSVWDEPFGLVAAEAQLLGIPVIAARRGALPEVVDGGRAGLVFEAERPASLAEAALRLAGDPALRAQIVDFARARARERYAYARWSREVAAVMREVDPGREPAARKAEARRAAG
ncbi:MAG TPA: glycosyltransferase family 4 protein [Anaeromyxobacter sp.]|jgi:glycosyltransferase involved in cell wall biosynthesis|nr:glycosyltransferase family 4 protein [Anaeromyxobacter sp.]